MKSWDYENNEASESSAKYTAVKGLNYCGCRVEAGEDIPEDMPEEVLEAYLKKGAIRQK